jgi:hypothetical protein
MSCPQVIKVVTPGPPGAAGPTGPAGVGAAWQQGAGAPTAGDGANGDFWLNTSNGDIYGPKTAGAWGAVIFNIAEGQQGPAGPAGATGATGATGAAGADGRTVLSGSGGPASELGADGDFFIDTTAWVIYGPKATGAWPGGASLVGPTGALQPASGYGTITYAAQVTLDFAALDKQMNTISLTGDLELLTSNLANGREVRLRLVNDATERTLTFPADWKFVGTKPATIPVSKVAILSIAAFGTTNADVVAAYAVQS